MASEIIRGAGDDAVVVDDRYVPIIVSTWFGAPPEPTIRGCFHWLREVSPRV